MVQTWWSESFLVNWGKSFGSQWGHPSNSDKEHPKWLDLVVVTGDSHSQNDPAADILPMDGIQQPPFAIGNQQTFSGCEHGNVLGKSNQETKYWQNSTRFRWKGRWTRTPSGAYFRCYLFVNISSQRPSKRSTAMISNWTVAPSLESMYEGLACCVRIGDENCVIKQVHFPCQYLIDKQICKCCCNDCNDGRGLQFILFCP